MLGLPGEDGFRLVPIDSPTLTPYQPDWNTAVNETLALRPELVLARQDLKFRQLDLINSKNLLMPDLRFTSTYALNGIGTHIDGNAENAFRGLASDRFTNWSLGLRLSYLIGYRDAHAQVRQAHLNLERSYLVLRDQELKAQRYLMEQYRRVIEFHDQMEIQRSQRLAAGEQVAGRLREYLAGRNTLDIYLESVRVWANALQAEYQAIAQYNNSLVGFEFAKGTILQYDSVTIGEGPLPHCAQVRAVEHERQRSLGLIGRERANPIPLPACDPQNGCVQLPQFPTTDGAPLGAVDMRGILGPHESHLDDPAATPQSPVVPQPQAPLPTSEPLSASLNKASFSPVAMPAGNLPISNYVSQPASARPAMLPSPAPSAASTTGTILLEDGWKKVP
jgi:hypothetical protein